MIFQKPLKLIFNQKFTIGLISLIAISCTSTAQQSSDFGTELDRASQNCTSIDLELPEDFVVYGASGYSGIQNLPRPIDNSGNIPSEIDVVVNSPSQPAVLFLGAYEPTVWDIQWTENTDILGVVAYGYYRQAVAGVPQDTPILINTFTECGENDSFISNLDEKYTLDQLSQNLFGKPLEQNLELDNAAIFTLGKSVEEDSNLISSDDIPVESFFIPNAPPVGDSGIEAALQNGILRPTTTEDLTSWVESYIEYRESSSENYFASAQERESYKAKSIAMLKAEQERGNTYVVLDEFTYPSGLFGSSKFFFVSKGVPQPSGEAGHSSVQDLTGKCLSLICKLNFDKNHRGYSSE